MGNNLSADAPHISMAFSAVAHRPAVQTRLVGLGPKDRVCSCVCGRLGVGSGRKFMGQGTLMGA